jgi:hypothetical protein
MEQGERKLSKKDRRLRKFLKYCLTPAFFPCNSKIILKCGGVGCRAGARAKKNVWSWTS